MIARAADAAVYDTSARDRAEISACIVLSEACGTRVLLCLSCVSIALGYAARSAGRCCELSYCCARTAPAACWVSWKWNAGHCGSTVHRTVQTCLSPARHSTRHMNTAPVHCLARVAVACWSQNRKPPSPAGCGSVLRTSDERIRDIGFERNSEDGD